MQFTKKRFYAVFCEFVYSGESVKKIEHYCAHLSVTNAAVLLKMTSEMKNVKKHTCFIEAVNL